MMSDEDEITLKFYYDLMSQPSRALYIIFKISQTQYEACPVALRKGEHLTDTFKNEVNRFQKVPCITESDGFELSESIAILRYLDGNGARISKSLYSDDHRDRAQIDEYLEWQHNNTRVGCAMYFRKKFLEPVLMGLEPNEMEIEAAKTVMIKSLDAIENIWLSKTRYLSLNHLTVSDIFALCEIEQICVTGYDPTEGRPKLTTWLKLIRKELKPHYEEAHKYIHQLAEKHNSKL